MKKSLVFIFSLLFVFACKSDQVEKVVATHSTNLPKIKEYYKKIEGKDVKVKEVRFFINGEKESEGGIKDGKKDGLWIFWYTNGEKWIEENYSDGVKNGAFTVWYQTGAKNYSGSYNLGRPSGEWIFWDENGSIIKKQQY